MASLARWIENWRRVAEAVPDGHYEPITAERDGQQYQILQISGFDPEIDGERRAVRTGSREFDDKVALFTHLTRDMGLARVHLGPRPTTLGARTRRGLPRMGR